MRLIWFNTMALPLAIALSAATAAHAAQQHYSYPDDRIAFRLGSEWKEMPAADLRELNDEMPKLVRGRRVRAVYRHGFVREPSKRDPRTAFLLIASNLDGRLAERAFDHPEKARQAIAAGLRLLDSTAQLGDVHYDAARRMLQFDTSLSTAGFGPLHALTGVYRTREGTIQIACYAQQSHFASFLPEFREIIGSLQLDRSLTAELSLWDRVVRMQGLPLPWHFALIGVAIGTVAGCLFVVRLRRFSSARNEKALLQRG